MRTLLLADDSVTTQRVIALTFAQESFRVVTVSDGQQALEAMAAMRPDIVLAGTTLPRTSGYELAQRMRGIEALRDVPVLLLSGAFESVDAAKLKASGARGVIEKPIEPTAVISRVRELLGLKDARPAAPAGRLLTSAEGPPDRKGPARTATPPAPAARKPAVSSWDELRQETGLEPDARSVEDGSPGPGREDYLDTLDAAFDSLDQHLAGRHQDVHPSHRNPSGPLGQASGAPDPRSPGRRPSMTTEGTGRNAVFEVDSDWFSDDSKARDQVTRNDIVTDAHEAMAPRTPDGLGKPIFEVDDEWFAEDEKARAERAEQQRQLVAEMGIHAVDLPEAEPAPNAPAPADGLDFDFGLDDLLPPRPAVQSPDPDSPFVTQAPAPPPVVTAPAPVAPVAVARVAPAPVVPAPVHLAPALAPVAPLAPVTPPAPLAPLHAASIPAEPNSVADDFAALLAFETGDAAAPPPMAAPAAPAVVVPAAAPEITEAMLDQLAQRVADRLNTSNFGADLREAMMAAVRDTVRTVVSETSDRLVRDEIARIKARAERDTP